MGQASRARQPSAACESWRFFRCVCGRRASRLILYGIAFYFFLFGPSARRHSRSYLRLALGRAPTARDRFLQILSFATAIHDRVYLINGQFEKFNISVQGEDTGVGA